MENQPKENNYENQTSPRDDSPADTELKETNNENLPIEESNEAKKLIEKMNCKKKKMKKKKSQMMKK